VKFQALLEAAQKNISMIDPDMKVVIAMFSNRFTDDHYLLPHTQHPYAELYNDGRLATSIANI
jgi:hypothetical protein